MSKKTDHLLLDFPDTSICPIDIVEHSPGYIYWKDKESKYLGCNLNWAKLVGLKLPAEITGKTDEDLPRGNWQPTDYTKAEQEVINTGVKNVCVGKLPVIRDDGKHIYVKIERAPIKDKNNEVQGLFVVAIDITDEKLTEYTPDTFGEDIFYKLPGLIYWKNKNSQYMGFNKNVVTLSGLSREELLGKTDKELNWGEGTAESFQQDDQEVMKTGQIKITEYEIPITRPDGIHIIVRTEKSRLFDRQGCVAGVLGVAMDVTDQKILEKKLGIANHGLTLMTSSVVHELRTPLASVSLATSTIAQHLPTLFSAYQSASENKLPIEKISSSEFFMIARCVENIKTEVNAANMFINMLLLNLAEPKTVAEKMGDCSIKQCVDMALERYPLTKQEKNKIFFKDDNDFVFKGDELLMTHIMFNLLKNSLYYINATGKGEIHIWLEYSDNMHKVHFKDTAKGISAEIMPHIFERFYSDTQGGSGIGLAFCKMAMELFGGDICCHSIEGSYAEFVLSFPNPTTHTTVTGVTH